jgi:hypothetical protein
MDLDLKPLGQILVLGAFAAYAILFLARICRAPWMPRLLSAGHQKAHLSDTAVYLAIVFSVGVVFKDVSKSIVAQRDVLELDAAEETAFTCLLNRFVLDTDNELRFRSLFDVRSGDIPYKAKNICRELLTLPKRHDTVQPYFEELKRDVDSADKGTIQANDKKAIKSLRRAVNQIYYEAKDRDYREQTYYQELSEISDKLDFTRSLTLLCLSFALVYFLFAFLSYIPLVIRTLEIDVKKRRIVFFLAVVYAACIWIAAFAYRSEATNYDLRVFGYYISLINDASPSAAPR